MSYRGKLIALLCLSLAGCSSVTNERPPDVSLIPPSTPAPAEPPVVEVVEVPPEISIAPATPPVAVVPPGEAPAAPVPVRPMPKAAQAAPIVPRRETWISIEDWCRANNLGAVRRTPVEGGSLYSFLAGNSQLTLRNSTQAIWWNGTEIRLSFAPQLSGGRLLVHSLDLEKNFEPLLHSSGSPSLAHRVVVIDPGHGGIDIGSTSVYDRKNEKQFTLDWAKRLQPLLVARGWTVYLTRETDTDLALSNRVAFAEQRKADLFLSLHFNSFQDKDQAGLETYCLTPQGMPSTMMRGSEDNAALHFPNNHFDSQNLQYAVRLHQSLLKVNGHNDRGVRKARFLGVLRNQNRPAVLVEGGYLSNYSEAKKIATPDYRQKLAEAIADALGPIPSLASSTADNPDTVPTPAKPESRVN